MSSALGLGVRLVTMSLSPSHPALRGLCHTARCLTRQSAPLRIHASSSSGLHRILDKPSLPTAASRRNLLKQSLHRNSHLPTAELTIQRSQWHQQRVLSAHRIVNLRTIRQLPKVAMKESTRCQQWAREQSGSASDNVQGQHFILSPKGILQAAPASIQPYLNLIRLDKPIGTWLLYLPCTWSIGLAAAPGCLPDVGMLALFGLGSFCMRGAGCTINDMWDRDFDKRVERCKTRPLAADQITYFQALAFLGLQLSASLGILLTLNWNTVLLGSCAMFLVVTYPLMKRITYWPQAFLGMTLNWGPLVAWSGLHGNLQLPGVILYVSCVFWTMIYDTIYSHQDKADDLLIGVKSTALHFGDDTKKWLLGFGTVMVGGLSVTGVMCDQTWPYFLGVGGVAAHILHQIYTVNLDNVDDCGRKFRSNRNLGLLFFGAIVAGNLLKPKQDDKSSEQSQDSKDHNS